MGAKMFYRFTIVIALSFASLSANAITSSNGGELFLLAYNATSGNVVTTASPDASTVNPGNTIRYLNDVVNGFSSTWLYR